jgi:multiple sugar transport system ATP-binding protein
MASGFPKRFDPVRKSLKLPKQESKGILMSEASVKIKELVKTYVDTRGRPTFTAVKNISLNIEAGEFMVLVGPSGCGKSTTLRMVAGLEDISSGTIEVGGEVVNDLEPKDRGIAMVFQNYV